MSQFVRKINEVLCEETLGCDGEVDCHEDCLECDLYCKSELTCEFLYGINWKKKYSETGIELSEIGWDSLMMEYCHVFSHKGISYMIYNGNEFGKEGFGYATQD